LRCEALADIRANTGFCRDCLTTFAADVLRCTVCKSPRIIQHSELNQLAIAHLDCDAFYASVEKRDQPELLDKPVIVGGARRGVVSTACYIARINGVRSAMPMFQALKLCPDAVVVKPNMAKYVAVAKQVRSLMDELTPLVQPVSIDEAFLDLGGTEKLHGSIPAISLAKLARRIQQEIGIGVSIGLSHNKFLAKMASDLQKPRGFSVIGKAETLDFLAARPVGAIWGVGKATQALLAKRGITMIAQLQQMEKNDLLKSFGDMGSRLYHLSRGQDLRHVSIDEDTKSVSAENTFNENISSAELLEAELWALCQRVSYRAKKSNLAGHTVTLKLKTKDFKSRTRACSVRDPTSLAHVIFAAAKTLLQKEIGIESFRLIGVGISNLEALSAQEVETFDTKLESQTKAELAMDKLRAKFGPNAVDRGITLKLK
jgi:DNA polymerase IV